MLQLQITRDELLVLIDLAEHNVQQVIYSQVIYLSHEQIVAVNEATQRYLHLKARLREYDRQRPNWTSDDPLDLTLTSDETCPKGWDKIDTSV